MHKIMEIIKISNDGIDDFSNTGYILRDLKTSFSSHCQRKQAVDCEDNRTISFVSHITKIPFKIIQERINNKINIKVAKERFGFCKNNGTREAIFYVRMLTEKIYSSFKKNVFYGLQENCDSEKHAFRV